MTDKAANVKAVDEDSDAYGLASSAILTERLYNNSSKELLYHYCSPATALIILQKRSLRFSDVTLLNDAEEALWSRDQVFTRALEGLRSGRGVPAEFPQVQDCFVENLARYFDTARNVTRHYAACFSLDADSLSQWRAYAQDAEGLALGFELISPSKGIYPMRVEYDPDTQLREMYDALRAIHERVGDELKASDDLTRHCIIALSNRSIAFKNPAFRDEHEVRLVGNVVTRSGTTMELEVAGWISAHDGWENITVKFEERRGTITPYFDLPYEVGPTKLELRAITLGPRCKSSIIDIQHMLSTLGHESVTVTKAGAAYRS
jgi:hypothetical protein